MKKPKSNKFCSYCGGDFYRKPSNPPSKSGNYYCCRAHKDAAQCVGNDDKWLNEPLSEEEIDAILQSASGKGEPWE